MSVGGSASAGKVGLAASASFGVPPFSIVLDSKSFKIGSQTLKLYYPKSPFIKDHFGGVGLSYNLASYPPMEVPYTMLDLHKQLDHEGPVHILKEHVGKI